MQLTSILPTGWLPLSPKAEPETGSWVQVVYCEGERVGGVRKARRRTANTACNTELLTVAGNWGLTLCGTMCTYPQNCSSKGQGARTLIPHQLWILPRGMGSLVFVGLPYSQLGQVPEAWGKGLRQTIETCGSHSGGDALCMKTILHCHR